MDALPSVEVCFPAVSYRHGFYMLVSLSELKHAFAQDRVFPARSKGDDQFPESYREMQGFGDIQGMFVAHFSPMWDERRGTLQQITHAFHKVKSINGLRVVFEKNEVEDEDVVSG